MKARVEVMLKNGVFDPQGKAISDALHHLDYTAVTDVKVGKVFYVQLSDSDKTEAEKKLHSMADELLANPVIENYRIDLID